MIQRPFVRSALLTALLAVSANAVYAITTHSNKNMLMPRSSQANAALEYIGWHGHVYDQLPAGLRSNLQIAPFYQESDAKKDLAQYFGIGNGSDTFTMGRATAYGGAAVANTNIDLPYILHAPTAGGGAPLGYDAAATVKLAPEQEQYGARLDFFQDLNTPIKNLFFRASTTAVHVQNNMHFKLSDVHEQTTPDMNLNIADVFSGAGSNAQQAALTKAKMGGRRSRFGLADIDFSLGHKCLLTPRSHAFFSIDMTVPTGNRVLADYVFAPVVGNGRHFALGASFDGGIDVWRNDIGSIRFNAAVRYKYLFENTEERTLSLRNGAHGTTGALTNMSKYYLVGQKNSLLRAKLQPLANISSMPVSVKPGHELDMLAMMSFEASKFTFDVGYNPFWRDAENVYVKNFAGSGQYAIADKNYDVATALAAFAAGVAGAGYRAGNELTLADFDISSIMTPTLLSHKLFAGAGYSWKAYDKVLCSVGLGGSYEFATSNADIENFAFWGKFNISF